MAKSFWAGFAKETTEILKESDARAYDMISKSLQYQAEDIRDAQKKRKATAEEMTVLAEGLADLGLDDDQINVVLKKGVKRATKFLEEAPEYAAKQQVSPATYVTLSDEAGDAITPSELIESGQLPGLGDVGSFSMPLGLDSSYQGMYDRQAEFLSSTMGLGGEETTSQEISPRGGTINWAGMLAEKPDDKTFELSTKQYDDQSNDFFVLASNLDREFVATPEGGRLRLVGEQKDVEFQIKELQFQVRREMNNIGSQYPQLSDDIIYMYALDNVIQDMSEEQVKNFPRLRSPLSSSQSSQGQPQQGTPLTGQQVQSNTVSALISAIDSDPKIISDAVRNAKKRSVLIRAGLAKTAMEADQLLKSGQY